MTLVIYLIINLDWTLSMMKTLQKNGENGNETEKFVSKLKNEYKIINTTTSK